MRISDWSSDVCSSDLVDAPVVEVDAHAVAGLDEGEAGAGGGLRRGVEDRGAARGAALAAVADGRQLDDAGLDERVGRLHVHHLGRSGIADRPAAAHAEEAVLRSEEHTSELQSLMRISYAVFCLKKKKQRN